MYEIVSIILKGRRICKSVHPKSSEFALNFSSKALPVIFNFLATSIESTSIGLCASDSVAA
jgi:hypothetical protein